jgi:hypothetical protein
MIGLLGAGIERVVAVTVAHEIYDAGALQQTAQSMVAQDALLDVIASSLRRELAKSRERQARLYGTSAPRLRLVGRSTSRSNDGDQAVDEPAHDTRDRVRAERAPKHSIADGGPKLLRTHVSDARGLGGQHASSVGHASARVSTNVERPEE